MVEYTDLKGNSAKITDGDEALIISYRACLLFY